ncbi:MAG: septum formation protein Maf [Chloroflexi bacterium]|nr:septum formation protein Maf [Chloroflexota bacterium]
MFPQTYHIECVATLERAGPGAILLASTSPRRRELVRRLGVPVQVMAPLVAEEEAAAHPDSIGTGGAPGLAVALARQKALSLARRARLPVLGADTIVVLDGAVLGKPASPEEARAMLRALRGRAHAVVTGVALAEPGGAAVHAEALETRVRMRDYSDAEIEAYVASGDPLDKAGAYAVQDATFHPAEAVEGCYLNVVGLPLCLADRLLREAGVPLPQADAPPQPPRCLHCARGRGGSILPMTTFR